jgi:hypothetical protein
MPNRDLPSLLTLCQSGATPLPEAQFWPRIGDEVPDGGTIGPAKISDLYSREKCRVPAKLIPVRNPGLQAQKYVDYTLASLWGVVADEGFVPCLPGQPGYHILAWYQERRAVTYTVTAWGSSSVTVGFLDARRSSPVRPY